MRQRTLCAAARFPAPSAPLRPFPHPLLHRCSTPRTLCTAAPHLAPFAPLLPSPQLPLGISTGLANAVGNELGAGRPEKARRLAVSGMSTGVVVILVYVGGVLLCAAPLARLFTADPEVLRGAAQMWPSFCLFTLISGPFALVLGLNRGLGLTRQIAICVITILWPGAPTKTRPIPSPPSTRPPSLPALIAPCHTVYNVGARARSRRFVGSLVGADAGASVAGSGVYLHVVGDGLGDVRRPCRLAAALGRGHTQQRRQNRQPNAVARGRDGHGHQRAGGCR